MQKLKTPPMPCRRGMESYFCYGWVGVTVDAWENPMLTGSAFDMDGGPMIVGGGSGVGPIPEPSSVLMMLLGVATLGLWRRWRMENVKWKT